MDYRIHPVVVCNPCVGFPLAIETSEFTGQKGIPTPTAHRILGLLRKHGVFKVLRESRGQRPGVMAFRELLNIVEGRDAF